MNDPFAEDLDRILKNFDGGKKQKEEYIRSIFKTEKYVSSEKVQISSNFTNPASAHRKSEAISVCQLYSEYIPGDTAIQILEELSPIVEVGAGNGYWSYVINQNSGSCYPTDRNPDNSFTEKVPVTQLSDTEDTSISLEQTAHTTWEIVDEMDCSVAIESNPKRTVLLCHPDSATRWTERVLDSIDSQQLVFIGQWFPGMDATPTFFERLLDWSLERTFPVKDTSGGHAQGYVFTRPD